MNPKYKRPAIIAVAVLAVAGIATAALWSGRDSDAVKLGLSSSAAKSGSSSESSETSLSSGSKDPSQAGSASSVSGGTSTGSSSSGTTGDGESGGTGSTTDASGKTIPGKTMKVRILWWNDSAEKQPRNAEVVFGDSSFKPDGGINDVGVIGPCPVGKKLQLVVYPDGRSGAKLVAEFLLNEDMLADSERDAIHVEVKDDGVRVLGNPVIDFTQAFKR